MSESKLFRIVCFSKHGGCFLLGIKAVLAPQLVGFVTCAAGWRPLDGNTEPETITPCGTVVQNGAEQLMVYFTLTSLSNVFPVIKNAINRIDKDHATKQNTASPKLHLKGVRVQRRSGESWLYEPDLTADYFFEPQDAAS